MQPLSPKDIRFRILNLPGIVKAGLKFANLLVDYFNTDYLLDLFLLFGALICISTSTTD